MLLGEINNYSDIICRLIYYHDPSQRKKYLAVFGGSLGEKRIVHLYLQGL